MIRVLVVEDSPTFRTLLVTLISSCGEDVEVKTADTLKHAKTLAHGWADVITVDLELPDSTTEQTLSKLRNGAAIVLISSHVDVNELGKWYDQGAHLIIPKDEATKLTPGMIRVGLFHASRIKQKIDADKHKYNALADRLEDVLASS